MYQYSPFGSLPTISAVSPTSNIPTLSKIAPGPVRQFVSTETLMRGIAGVDVKSGVAERVGSRVNVGVSGVEVNVAVAGFSKAASVWRAITVCAMEVLCVFGSAEGTETDGLHARDAVNKTIADTRMECRFAMILLSLDSQS